MRKKDMHLDPVSLLRRHISKATDPLILLTLNRGFRRFWLSWAMIHANTGEGDVESPLPAQNGYEVQTGGKLSLPLARCLGIVDGDTLFLRRDGLAVGMNPRSAISAKGSVILLKIVHLMGTTG